MRSDIAILSIHSDHAHRIYSSEKYAELRKSFNDKIRLVFLYETAPAAAVTGCFFVNRSFKATIEEIVEAAPKFGVSKNNVYRYFSGRGVGWLIEIQTSVRFRHAIKLRDLQALNHYYKPPQAYAYLDRFEAFTQHLMAELIDSSQGYFKLRPLSSKGRTEFSRHILSDVGLFYDEIDEDFVAQVSNEPLGAEAAFSTKKKLAREVFLGKTLIGFTVVTEKFHGSWKTGPTILLPGFRGLGLGQSIRKHIDRYCKKRGARGIYCTCASTEPSVISYLLNSGFQFQARLRSHLSDRRDEFVFAKHFYNLNRKVIGRKKNMQSKGVKLRPVRLNVSQAKTERVLVHLSQLMRDWYFEPPNDFVESIKRGMIAHESGKGLYSGKPKEVFSAYDGANRPRLIAVVTHKRSNMSKINLVSTLGGFDNYFNFLRFVISSLASKRRIYITSPADENLLILALEKLGFEFEGILLDPFGTGVDHVCFGLIQGGVVSG